VTGEHGLEATLEIGLDIVPGLAGRAAEVAQRFLRADPAAARAKGERGDVVTDADLAAERLIVDGLRAHFPGHQIQSEEAGLLDGDPAWRWLVDPLDGTNNLALGLPLLGVCISLVHDDEAVLSVIRDGSRGRTFTAAAGRGARCDGVPLSISAPPAPPLMTVSWMQGYAVDEDDAFADRAPRALARSHKRVLRTWAPAIDWALTATGRVAAVVAHRNETEDLVAGLLLIREAGGVIRDRGGAPLGPGAATNTVIAGHPDGVAAVLATLGRAEPAE
jgi:myo-inositol-1(or 4)-monophosphatase